MSKLIVDCYFFFLCIFSVKGKNEHDDSPISSRALAVVPLTNTEIASIPPILPSGNLIPTNSNSYPLRNADISVKANPKSGVPLSNTVASLSNPGLIPTVFNNVDTAVNSADAPPHYAIPGGALRNTNTLSNLKDSHTSNLIPSKVNDTFINAEAPHRKLIPDPISKKHDIIVPNTDSSNEHNPLLPKLNRVDTSLIHSISSNRKKLPITSVNAISDNNPKFRAETGEFEADSDENRVDSNTSRKGATKGTTKAAAKATAKATTKAAAKKTTKADAKKTTKADAKKTTKADAKKTTKADAKKTTKADAKKTTKADAKKTTKADAKKTTKADAKKTTKADAKKTTKADATKTTKADAKKTTKADAKKTTKADAKKTTKADAKKTTKADATKTTKADAKKTTKADAKKTTKADAKKTTKADAKKTTKADAKKTTKADAKKTTKADAKKTTKADAKKTTKADAKKTTKADAKKTTKADAKKTTKADAKKTTKADAKKTTKADAKKTTKADAKKTTKADAKKTTKADAKKTTKADAKKTTKADAKKTTKADAKKTTKAGAKKTTKAGAKATTKGTQKKTTKQLSPPHPTNTAKPKKPTNSVNTTQESGSGKPIVTPVKTEGTTIADRNDDLEWTSDKTVDWINKYLENLARRFPKITTLVTIGKSAEGVPIYAIEVMQMYITGATIVIDGGMEATDRTGVTFAIFVVHQLIERLNQNLLTLYGVKIIIVPLVNPDGYTKHLQGIPIHACKQDFSTNFEVGISTTEQGCIKGRSTHAETMALSAYYKKLTQFKLYLNLMGGSASIYYSYGIHSGVSVQSSTMVHNMKAVLDSKGSVGNINIKSFYEYFKEIVGTSVDWCYDKLKVRYAMQVWIPKFNNHEAKLKAMTDYFEAVRYAILELQLTDVEVADAVYSVYNSIGRITLNVKLLVCIFLILLYFK